MLRRLYLIWIYALLLLVFSISPAKAGTVQLPKTGQTICYDSSGNVIACSNPAYPGEDGELQMGIAWPSPRFTANGDATLTDNLTTLIWSPDGSTPTDGGLCTGGATTWQGALNYVACLNTNNYLGHSDWRLPNVNELESIVNDGQSNVATWLNGQGFSNVQWNYYWSSTSYASNPSCAWSVFMYDGDVLAFNVAKSYSYYVWPVRGGQGTSVIWRTGQTTSYAPGDDGDLQEGVAWPSPRFTNNGNQTVTDNLTTLMWTIDGSTPTYGSCTGGTTTWQGALNYVACLNTNNYLGHNDWRLPNQIELHSLSDFSQENPSIPAGNPFTNVLSNDYWSSTSYARTYAGSASYAWYVSMDDGGVYPDFEPGSDYVWPVRGGQSGSLGYLISGTITYNGTGISGVTVTLSGAGSGTTTTDSNGNYYFSGLSNGSYTVTPSKSGYTFTPDNITISGANSTGDNILASSGGSGSGSGSLSARAGGYSPAWLIITLISLTLAGGYLMRNRMVLS